MCFSVKKWHEKTSLACNFKRDAFLLTLGENFTRHGARIPESQLEKDSGKLNLLVSCQFPNHKVMLKCYIRYSAQKFVFNQLHLQGFKTCQNRFTHMPTQRGICSVYNGQPLEGMLDPSLTQWFRGFQKYYKTRPSPAPGDLDVTSLQPIVESGISRAMKLILDMHQK